MNHLPFEIVSQIFDQLPIKDLCTICHLNSFWQVLGSQRLYKIPKITHPDQFKTFISHITPSLQSYIQELDLSEVSHCITDASIASSLTHLTQLRYLNLSNCMPLSPTTIYHIIQKSLSTLNILLLANCKLSVDMLSLIGTASRLMTLDLSNTMISPCISIDSAHHLDSMLSGSIGSSPLQIMYLNLSFCSWVEHQTIINISKALPNLRHIVLQWCNKLKPETILAMTKELSCLKVVDIRNIGCIELEDQANEILNSSCSLEKVLFTNKRISSQVVSSF